MSSSQSDLFQVISISGGKDQTLALLKSGEILGWGSAGSGRITSPYIDICSSQKNTDSKPVFIGYPTKFSNTSAGYGTSLGISERLKAYIWGFCQVGVGGKASFSEEPTLIDDIADAIKVAAGQFLYAAIDQAGKVYTWGLYIDGALGRPSTQINALPGLVPDLPEIEGIKIGDNFMIALTKDQRVYGWGSNSAGQMGLGHLNVACIPELIPLPGKISNIAIGSTHVLAVSTEGKVYGWGSNHFGQAGGGPQSYIDRPQLIPFPEMITSVSAGMHYSLALSASGKVYSWGWNGFGQLGHGDLLSRSAPTLIPKLSGVRMIAAGEAHTLAIGKDQLLGWGSNESGQLGKAAIKQLTPNAFLAIA